MYVQVIFFNTITICSIDSNKGNAGLLLKNMLLSFLFYIVNSIISLIDDGYCNLSIKIAILCKKLPTFVIEIFRFFQSECSKFHCVDNCKSSILGGGGVCEFGLF